MTYHQFEVVQVNLKPTKGSEQKGIRPCIIFQSNAVSDLANTTLIIPFSSSKLEYIYPYELLVEKSNTNGLQKNSKLKCDQIRVIDSSRILKKLGVLEKKHWELVFTCVDTITDRTGNFWKMTPST